MSTANTNAAATLAVRSHLNRSYAMTVLDLATSTGSIDDDDLTLAFAAISCLVDAHLDDTAPNWRAFQRKMEELDLSGDGALLAIDVATFTSTVEPFAQAA